jgi:beta-lactamase superfamily II metal-dependent hydrolase
MSIIKSFSVGDGDMFYIKHNTDNFTIIECCMCDDDRETIVDELKRESKDKGITRFISTHPDDDHIGGLTYLHEQMPIVNFYTVKNSATKKPECWTEDFGTYCELRDDSKKAFYIERGCKRLWVNESNDQRGGAGIHILWPIVENSDYKEALAAASKGDSPNNISPIVTYSLNEGAEVIWMGDLESDFQEKIKKTITLPSMDVLFAPHHGRDSGKVVQKWLDDMSPKLIVIGEAPSEHLCYYAGYNCITQNSAGAITFDCTDDGKIHIYVENRDYSVKFLKNEKLPNKFGGYYLGTLVTKSATAKQAASAAAS